MTTAGWVAILALLTAVTLVVAIQRLASRRVVPGTHTHWRGAQGHSLVIVAALGVIVLLAVTAWGQGG